MVNPYYLLVDYEQATRNITIHAKNTAGLTHHKINNSKNIFINNATNNKLNSEVETIII
jgi:hypothetical protein